MTDALRAEYSRLNNRLQSGRRLDAWTRAYIEARMARIREELAEL